jgi:hypothetical protein
MDEELHPKCLSIVLCDQVIEDKRTNKKSLIGTFNDIFAGKVPAKHPCMFLMLSLTNCRRPFDIALEVSRDTEQGGERLLSLKGPVQGKNPLAVLDLVFELHGVALPAFGQYTIDVTLQPDAVRLAQRSFYVREMPKPPTPEGGKPKE